MIKTKVFGEKKKRAALSILKSAITAARFENASFSQLHGDLKYPKREEDVTEFIKERTRLYMDSWVIWRLKEIEDLINGRDRRYDSNHERQVSLPVMRR